MRSVQPLGLYFMRHDPNSDHTARNHRKNPNLRRWLVCNPIWRELPLLLEHVFEATQGLLHLTFTTH